MKKSKPFAKITLEDFEIAANFFENDKRFDEFICNVLRYYFQKPLTIKTKSVKKFFETYKKTMDFIIDSKNFGLQSADNRGFEEDTLTGGLPTPLTPPLQPPLPTNSKEEIVNSKLKIDNSKKEKEKLFAAFAADSQNVTLKSKKEKKDLPGGEKKLADPDYQLCIEVYKQWIEEKTSMPLKFDGSEGAALKTIITYCKSIEKVRSGETTIPEVLTFIFNQWHRLDDFLQQQITLKQINSNFTKILNQIKNGHNGKSPESKLARIEQLNRAADAAIDAKYASKQL